MIEYVLMVSLLALISAGLVVSVWSTKVRSRDQQLETVAIYRLYEEIKRMNDEKELTAIDNEKLYNMVADGKKRMDIRHGNG